jgi:hypothetical protein
MTMGFEEDGNPPIGQTVDAAGAVEVTMDLEKTSG